MAEFSRLGGETMGTFWSVQFADPLRRDLHALHATAEQALDLVVAQMSTWEPNSEISRFNDAPAGTWVPVSKEFMDVLQCAVETAHVSAGAFDPCVGRLVSLWGFGAHASDHTSRSQITDALHLSNFRHLQVNPADRTVLQTGHISLDLSAIAKGFAVDLLASRLQEHGVSAALVEVGGELFAFGESSRGGAWNVLLETGADEDGALGDPRVIALNGSAVATSGDRWFRHERDNRLVSHSIDPRSGEPIANSVAAVTVIHQKTMQADALATALSVMGINQGLAFAHAHGIAARFVERTADGAREHFSDSFERHLVS